jgi:ATP-dependent Clp protease ATP-binding subunit ClpC
MHLYKKIKKELKISDKRNIIDISIEDVTTVISRITDIPVSSIYENKSQKLLNMEEELSKVIIGQDDAIKVVSASVRRSRTGIKNPKKSTGIFLFLGPTVIRKCFAKKKK